MGILTPRGGVGGFKLVASVSRFVMAVFFPIDVMAECKPEDMVKVKALLL